MRYQRANRQHPDGLPVFPVFRLCLFRGNDAGGNNLETRLQEREQVGHAVGQKPGRHNHPLRNMEELLKIPKPPAGLLRSCLCL